jgi:hypothetical protein
MEALVPQIDFATVLDGLAMTCSLVLILFLLLNRLKYGRIVLDAHKGKGRAGFADQVSLHMMTQQSQKAYDHLQQSLTKEFESLRLMGAELVQSPANEHGHFPKTTPDGGRERRRRYRLAEEMMRRGDSADQIRQQCGLMAGELELLRGLQTLAEKRPPVHATEPRPPVVV